MRPRLLLFTLLALFLFLIAGAVLFNRPSATLAADLSEQQSTFEKREAAYRANNIGVALLEQYKAREAIESFQRALEIKPDLLLARINLAIAFYYLPDAEAGKREAEKALRQDATAPQPHYVLGLIARAQNQLDQALAEFEKVLKLDPDDVGTNVNVGQIFVQQRKSAEAIAAFRRGVAGEPYNETALYNLGLLLTRTGKRDEGQQLLRKFQQLKESGAGTSIGNNYLEGGRYAEAVVSTGAENELVDRAIPEVRFVDETHTLLPAETHRASTSRERTRGFYLATLESKRRMDAIVLFDYDGDNDLDVFDASGSQRLLRNHGGKFVDVTAGSGLSNATSQHGFAAIAGDYDNDLRPDLFVARFAEKQFLLYRNDGNGHFSDRAKSAKIEVPMPEGSPYLSAAFADVDHDGDLDLFIAGPTNVLYRNNGDQTFTNITQAANVNARNSFSSSSSIIPTDFNNRRDIDLFLLPSADPPKLLSNLRDGTFRDVTNEVGLNGGGPFWCAAAGDVNKDGFTDFFLSSDSRAAFAISNGRGRFSFRPAPAGSRQAMAAQFLDYDNDGLLDLVALTTRGLNLWRNVGSDFVDVSVRALPTTFRTLDATFGFRGMFGRQTALASGDLDGDGDVELILRGAGGGLRVLRNDGGDRNRSIKIDLHGRVSNRSAVQAKVEMRAGSLYQKLETYSASPAPAPAALIFGLGKRDGPDAVRVLWPAGVLQAETEFPAPAPNRPRLTSLNITELDRKPSSCPYLYTWNGERFEFVTDFMGGGEIGYLEEPAGTDRRAIASGLKARPRYNTPDTDEYVRITSDQLKPKDGRYELRVTNELEEALFVDRLELLAVAHPLGTEIYPNEGMTHPPKPFRLFVTREARPPVSAVDEHGHDVLELISRLDRRWPDDFKVDRIRGYADEHALTVDTRSDGGLVRQRIGTNPKSKRKSNDEHTVLLLTGWTDYAWSSDNVAAAQAARALKPPSLQVKDKNGDWRTVIENIGVPVGRPQTVTVDLTNKFLSASREVRIATNMRIYWDRISIATSGAAAESQFTRLDPIRTDLRWRGFSAELSPDGREPLAYDYHRVSFTSPWKVMTGRYTREGDVRELLLNTDDMFVICRTGDEISLSFDAASLPPLPPGWTRTFLLYSDGFSKEMDINSASPDQVGPLPFHGMSGYPYRWPERYPIDAKRRDYIGNYNTRPVTTPVASIESLLLDR
jgi:tetratricopeptide (TPR) repeat protein